MSNVTVFIGDSVTDCGRLIEPPFGDGYVFNIANSGRLTGSIINVGTSGHRLIDLENRWNNDVLAHQPTLVSVAIGINDTWRRYDDNDPTSVEDFEERYRHVLTATKAQGNPQLVLCDGVTYDTTWTTSDYQLEPLNGVAGGLVGHPATRIRAVGDYLLPAWATGTIYNLEASMQVVGVFGWSAIPAAIRQATVILAMRIFKRLDAPLGMITNDMGSMRVGRFDPDVEALVMPFRKVSAG